ncbi:hypothetical protein NDU88_002531, partial [Pleurodeles waltl]
HLTRVEALFQNQANTGLPSRNLKSFSEPIPSSTPSFLIPKKPVSELKKRAYTEEHGLSKVLKERQKSTEEDSQMQPIIEQMDERQARIHIHKETGRILNAPPPKPKRKLDFQEELDTAQPPAKVPRTKE